MQRDIWPENCEAMEVSLISLDWIDFWACEIISCHSALVRFKDMIGFEGEYLIGRIVSADVDHQRQEQGHVRYLAVSVHMWKVTPKESMNDISDGDPHGF